MPNAVSFTRTKLEKNCDSKSNMYSVQFRRNLCKAAASLGEKSTYLFQFQHTSTIVSRPNLRKPIIKMKL